MPKQQTDSHKLRDVNLPALENVGHGVSEKSKRRTRYEYREQGRARRESREGIRGKDTV